MYRIKTWFNNLSLYKKILLIVSIAMIGTYIVFFISIQFLTERYGKELYQTNAQALNHVSTAISRDMQMIENISANITSDTIIQDNLYDLKEFPYSSRKALSRRDIYQSLYPYTFQNNYIKSIHIILDDGTDIFMGNSAYLDNFNLEMLQQNADKAKGQLIWSPSKIAGSDVVCVRQIRQLKYLKLEKLADLYIVINLEQMIEDSLSNAGYKPDNSNFIVMSEGKRIYPGSPYHDYLYADLMKKMDDSGELFTIATIDGNKEFIIANTIPYTGWNYLYFRDYAPIFHNIQSAKFRVLLFSISSGIITLGVVQLVYGRILKHLDFLVKKIRNFGNGAPNPEDERNYDYSLRQDEIGQLHRNFDEMTKSVKVLRDENYDKQILLRDATIKMLQQQINPHFLYNTLDTINWMAQKYGADEISLMVRSLGNLFRASITGHEDLIPLSDELSVLDNYIQIQKIRFKDRLNFELVVPEDISHIQIPKLCIQPLVENALKHAMEYSNEICTIRVTICEYDHDYRIKVANTGSQFEDDLLWKIETKQVIPQGSGVGLTNIDSRMKLLYGDHYGLTFNNKDGMAVVMLLIPKKREI